MTTRDFIFTGGERGPWRVLSQRTIVGEPLASATHLHIRPATESPAVGVWQLRGITLAPVDLRPDASSYRQHAHIDVQTSDLPFRCDSVGSRPGKHTSPTSDIEHTISGGQPGSISQSRRPLTKNGRDKALLIDFRRRSRDLPAFLLRHRFSVRPERCRHVGRHSAVPRRRSSPGVSPPTWLTASSIGPTHWPNNAGTTNCSYTSAAARDTCPAAASADRSLRSVLIATCSTPEDLS